MEHYLEYILNKLHEIQVDLRKLGPTRRLRYSDTFSLEAQKLFFACNDIISNFDEQECKGQLTNYIFEIRERIELAYNKILSYKVNCEDGI